MPAEARVAQFLARARRRVMGRAALAGATAGAIAAVVVMLAAWAGALGRPAAVVAATTVILSGAIGGAARAWRARREVADDVERRVPACRNLLVTASEMAQGSVRLAGVPPDLRRLVFERAAAIVNASDVRAVYPLARSVIGLATSVAALVAVSFVAAQAPLASERDSVAVGDTTVPEIARVEIVATPPAYTGLPAAVHVDATRIDVVAGSQLDVRVQALATRVQIGTPDGVRELASTGDGGFTGTLVATGDGWLSLEPLAGNAGGVRRIVGVGVQPDRPPTVSITRPAEDLFLPDATRTIAIAIEAADDFGLASLRLSFTKVSGSGETFTFTDGDVPLDVTRTSGARWTARGELVLPALGLSLGDTVVYRARARDVRPGSPEVESDAFLVEIIAPDAAVAGGFAVDDDEERQGLSQQMVIVKTERLIARRAGMTTEEVADEARRLAAEQRMVRAEFVFMMGGEIADEVEEAEHSHEIAEGRLEHRGRQEMSRAVVAMSQAAAALAGSNLQEALALERTALSALQRALVRSRYILRTLAERERIDPARRLTGESTAARAPRDVVERVIDAEADALRVVIREAAGLAAGPLTGRDVAASLNRLAEATLRLGPSIEPLQQASATLAEAALFAAQEQDGEARTRLDLAVEIAGARLRGRLPAAPPHRTLDRALAGALADRMARGGGR